ncbi:MAG: hypothetical protein KatS3mg053_2017 [Candidatus Roseilinea sp.]|nr:MAG: hypothetical protein KatS3mg053_2017 [Candidatus Roseilinea sp.]
MIEAGFAEADITPPVGAEMPGGLGKAYVTAICARANLPTHRTMRAHRSRRTASIADEDIDLQP